MMVINFGGQTARLIPMLLERAGIFAPVADCEISAADVKLLSPAGIILTGGPSSVYEDPPPFDEAIYDLGIPVLGICLGQHMLAKHFGFTVRAGEKREFGPHTIQLTCQSNPLFEGIPSSFSAFQNHGDLVVPDEGMGILALSDNAVAAISIGGHYGVQFHPEVSHTEYGQQILINFAMKICGIDKLFPAKEKAQAKIEELRQIIGDHKVLAACSGGADSSTAIQMLIEAVNHKGGHIRATYLKGIDRPDDEAHVIKHFGNHPCIELEIIDKTADFLVALKGKTEMKAKRLAVIGVYNSALEGRADNFGAPYILDGTLLTDLVESGHGAGAAVTATIKIHHNTKPFSPRFTKLSPLSDDVKDTGRAMGRSLGVASDLIDRHPFPGPGVVVRIEGEVTAEKLCRARAHDEINIRKLREWGLYGKVWQTGTVETASQTDFSDPTDGQNNLREGLVDAVAVIIDEECGDKHRCDFIVTRSETTCIKGDGDGEGKVVALDFEPVVRDWALLRKISQRLTNEIREIGAVVVRIGTRKEHKPGTMVALWAVDSVNGFTATPSELPWNFFDEVADEIRDKVPETGSVVLRISPKPPATIEWG